MACNIVLKARPAIFCWLCENGHMRRITAASALIAILLPALVLGQVYGRRTRGANTTNVGPLGGPAVTFQGPLKALNKKEIRIDINTQEGTPAANAEEQSLTFRVTHKTRFMKDGKEIKPADIALGTVVAVDAERDPDQKFSALNVIVNPPKPKPAEQ